MGFIRNDVVSIISPVSFLKVKEREERMVVCEKSSDIWFIPEDYVWVLDNLDKGWKFKSYTSRTYDKTLMHTPEKLSTRAYTSNGRALLRIHEE